MAEEESGEAEERDLQGEREVEREVRNWEIGTDEKRNFKTAAYIIQLIKDAFILEGFFWSVCVRQCA